MRRVEVFNGYRKEKQVDETQLAERLVETSKVEPVVKFVEFERETKNKVMYTDGDFTIYLFKDEAKFPNHPKMLRVEVTPADG